MEPITFKIGRDPKNDLIVQDKAAELVHANLFLNKGNQWEIVDLNSKTGVWVNQKKIMGSQILQFGDEIRIGFQIIDWNKIEQLHSKATESIAKASKGDLNVQTSSVHQTIKSFEKTETASTIDRSLKSSANENEASLVKDKPLVSHSKPKSEFQTQVRIVKGTSLSFEEKTYVKPRKSNDFAGILAALLFVILMLAAGYFISQAI